MTQAVHRYPPLTIEALDIGKTSVQCDVVVRSDSFCISDSSLNVLITLLPTLPYHACASGGVGVFRDKMRESSLPHLAEHVAIDLLVKTYSAEGVGFAGNTVWLDKSRNLMRIRVSYQDAKVTKAALLAAVNLINQVSSEVSFEDEAMSIETTAIADRSTVPSPEHHPSPRIMAILQDLEAQRNI